MTALLDPEHPGRLEAEVCQVRDLALQDVAAVKRLFHDGLLPGQMVIDPADLDRLEQLRDSFDGWRFWVAEAGGQIVGSVAIATVNRDVVELRWLRVAPAWQAGHRVARRLIAQAAAHIRDMGYLKLILHAPADVRPQAIGFFHCLGFLFSRSSDCGEWKILEFLLDLYRDPDARPPDQLTDDKQGPSARSSPAAVKQQPSDAQEAPHGQHQE